MKLVESLIGREVTVGQGSECHLTFVRGLLHIAQQDPRIDHKHSETLLVKPDKKIRKAQSERSISNSLV